MDINRGGEAMSGNRITTAEELDALPVGSVVLDGIGDAWQRSDAHTDWWCPANPFYIEDGAATVLALGGTHNPVTVLYRPDTPRHAPAALLRCSHWLVGRKVGLPGLYDLQCAREAGHTREHLSGDESWNDPAGEYRSTVDTEATS